MKEGTMKTIVIFKKGTHSAREEQYDEVMPSFSPDDFPPSITMIDKDSVTHGGEIPLEIIEEIRWVNERSM